MKDKTELEPIDTQKIFEILNEVKKPENKEIKIKCLQGQMKEGEKEIDCSSYPKGMKHEVLSHYQSGYIRGLSIGVDQACDQWQAYLDSLKPLSLGEVEKIVRPSFDRFSKNGLMMLKEQADELTSEIAKALAPYMNKVSYDDFLKQYYNSPCEGCPEGHHSFWKTIIESKEWEGWKKVAHYDIAECEELGIMSEEHFKGFVKFLRGSVRLPTKRNTCPHQSVNPKQLCMTCQEVNETIDSFEELNEGRIE